MGTVVALLADRHVRAGAWLETRPGRGSATHRPERDCPPNRTTVTRRGSQSKPRAGLPTKLRRACFRVRDVDHTKVERRATLLPRARRPTSVSQFGDVTFLLSHLVTHASLGLTSRVRAQGGPGNTDEKLSPVCLTSRVRNAGWWQLLPPSRRVREQPFPLLMVVNLSTIFEDRTDGGRTGAGRVTLYQRGLEIVRDLVIAGRLP